MKRVEVKFRIECEDPGSIFLVDTKATKKLSPLLDRLGTRASRMEDIVNLRLIKEIIS